MAKITVVILTCNSLCFIKSCLDSVFAQDFQHFETIVVDNGSSDGTVSFVKKTYPEVILIENKTNLGAAKARNQGIDNSKGDWIVTLDCDVVLENNFLANIAEAIRNLPPAVGIIQPKILKADKKTIYSKGIFLSSFRRFYDIDRGKLDNGRTKDKYIFGACSAASVLKRSMLEQIKENTGYFDERFFFLVEDVDLSWRAQKNNWKASFLSNAICYHFGNSSGLNKKIRQYLCFRNRCRLILKNEGLKIYLRKIAPFIFYDLPRVFYLTLTNRYMLSLHNNPGLNFKNVK